MKAQSFSKSSRLLNSFEFRSVMKSGKKISGAHFLLFRNSTSLKISRLGISVSKKIGNAVTRNRVKRMIREFFRKQIGLKSYDWVFIAKGDFLNLSKQKMAQEIQDLFHRCCAK